MSLLLDGIDDKISFGDADAFSFAGTPQTLEAWVKLTEARFNPVLTKFNGTGTAEYTFRVNVNGQIGWYLYDGAGSERIGVESADSVVGINTWYHLAATYDGGGSSAGMTIYLDGVDATDHTNDAGTYAAMDNTAEPLLAGSRASDSSFLKGHLYELRIWGEERSQANIAANMSKHLLGTETNLLAYWKLDEGTGITANDSVGSLDGTITGATWQSDVPFTDAAFPFARYYAWGAA